MQQLPEGERAHSCEAATKLLTRDTRVVSHPEVRDLQISGRTATARVTSKGPPGIKAHDDEPHGRE
jgi:hypothetical protein